MQSVLRQNDVEGKYSDIIDLLDIKSTFPVDVHLRWLCVLHSETPLALNDEGRLKLGKDVSDELPETFGILLRVNCWDFCSCLQNTRTGEFRNNWGDIQSHPVHFTMIEISKQRLPTHPCCLTPCLTALAAWAAFFLVSYCVSTSIRPIKYTSLWGAPTVEWSTAFGKWYWSVPMCTTAVARQGSFTLQGFYNLLKITRDIAAVGTHPQHSE